MPMNKGECGTHRRAGKLLITCGNRSGCESGNGNEMTRACVLPAEASVHASVSGARMKRTRREEANGRGGGSDRGEGSGCGCENDGFHCRHCCRRRCCRGGGWGCGCGYDGGGRDRGCGSASGDQQRRCDDRAARQKKIQKGCWRALSQWLRRKAKKSKTRSEGNRTNLSTRSRCEGFEGLWGEGREGTDGRLVGR